MSQTDGPTALLPSLQPSSTDAPTIIPIQADYGKKRSTVNIVGKEERRYQSLNEQQSQDNVELIWEREQQRVKEREEIQDKFATLFEPPTPRASPTLLPSSLPPAAATTVTNLPLFDHSRPATLRHRSSQIFRPRHSSSDFGSFVGASEDPLSFALAHEHTASTRGDATPSAENTVTPSLFTEFDEVSFQRRPFSSYDHFNKTLKFFDMFTYDATQRASAARSQVLDELLLHEDDPMWFVHEGRNDAGVANDAEAEPPSPHATLVNVITDSPSKDSDIVKRTSKSFLLDIDHDYFRPSHSPPSHASPRSLSPIRHRMPSRSSSIPPPAIAPPIACPLTASPPTVHYLQFDPLVDGGHIKPPDSSIQAPTLSERSSSLSSLSSKLMSSLLRSTQTSPPSTPVSKIADTQPTILDHAEEHTSASTIDSHLPVLTENDSIPQRPLALSSTMSPASEGRVTHFSVSKQRIPFAPAIVTHSTSPFAPSFYNSPSGAPGFKGDRYDWDKGFSDALESEQKGNPFASADGNGSDDIGGVSRSVASSSVMSGSWGTGFGFGFGTVLAGKPNTPSPSSSVLAQANELNIHGREGSKTPPVGRKVGSDRADWRDHDSGYNRHERHLSSTSSTSGVSVGGMGDLIERKVGTIELVGRRASSDSVLMPNLASMLHAHLPALSRLPRSWRLIYSLDQDGISLKTLYSHCEVHRSQKLAPSDLGVGNGMLLAVKDGGAGEENRAIFGAWIAEGLKLNKGKGYSGGGESFLWKYVDGILKVFKATGKNNYIALCEPDYISFGGGDGHYGLYLDDTLFEGSSASCPTFDNEPLCNGHLLGSLRTVKFECLGLEVWGMA